MKLIFKQRLLSLLDSYDIYNEDGSTAYIVRSQLAFGHVMHITDAAGNNVGTIEQKILTLLPKFEIYLNNQYAGCISKELTLFHPRYHIDYNGWYIEGSIMEWDYQITDAYGRNVATISKELLNWTDTYVIDVQDPESALVVLMFVLAIDAEKCSRNN